MSNSKILKFFKRYNRAQSFYEKKFNKPYYRRMAKLRRKIAISELPTKKNVILRHKYEINAFYMDKDYKFELEIYKNAIGEYSFVCERPQDGFLMSNDRPSWITIIASIKNYVCLSIERDILNV